jgi:hypothetical protein
MDPEHDGQLSGDPLRSLLIRKRAWAGLYAFGRGLRMSSPVTANTALHGWRRLGDK